MHLMHLMHLMHFLLSDANSNGELVLHVSEKKNKNIATPTDPADQIQQIRSSRSTSTQTELQKKELCSFYALFTLILCFFMLFYDDVQYHPELTGLPASPR